MLTMTNEDFQKLMLEQNSALAQGQKELIAGQQLLQQALVKIENQHGEKFDSLLDASEVQIDVNERICDTLNRIESKMDRLVLKVSNHDTLLRKAK